MPVGPDKNKLYPNENIKSVCFLPGIFPRNLDPETFVVFFFFHTFAYNGIDDIYVILKPCMGDHFVSPLVINVSIHKY